MPLLGIVLVALQIFFAVHAIRNGKDPIWIWIIILAPGIGCAIYFITQFGPQAANSRTARQAKNTLIRAVDPRRELRNRMELLEISNTVENRVGLADECVEAGLYAEAISLYNDALVGVHADDPGIMEKRAVAQFKHDEPEKTLQTLDVLIEKNPQYKSSDAHLLYARALQALDKIDEALEEYEVLRNSYPGEEARVRYAQLLQQRGDEKQADELFKETLLRIKRAPKHYAKKEREWLKIAERG